MLWSVRLGDMRAIHVLPLLALSCLAAACVTQPKSTSPTGGGTTTTATFPETMTFGAEADAGPVAAQLEKFLARLEQAERWGRPLLLATVGRRLSIPLPPICAGWGQVSVVVPPAPEGAAPDAPTTRFLFAVRNLKPVGPEEAHGPEEEPEKKATDPARNLAAVVTCAALIVPGTTHGTVRLGVVPVRADGDWPRVAAASAVADFLLMHLATDRAAGSDAFAWRDGHTLLFFGRGIVKSVGAWPQDTPPLPAAWDFTARLGWSAAFERLVLVLTSTETAPTFARCAWIDPRGALTGIPAVEFARLARETGYAPCATPDSSTSASTTAEVVDPEPKDDEEQGEELP